MDFQLPLAAAVIGHDSLSDLQLYRLPAFQPVANSGCASFGGYYLRMGSPTAARDNMSLMIAKASAEVITSLALGQTRHVLQEVLVTLRVANNASGNLLGQNGLK